MNRQLVRKMEAAAQRCADNWSLWLVWSQKSTTVLFLCDDGLIHAHG